MARRHSHGPLLAAVLAIAPLITSAGRAIPRLDLSPYPKPAPGERRWVIQLPGVLPPAPAGGVAGDPRSWGVQLVVGEEMPVDCNIRRISGQLRVSDVPGWGYPIYRLEGPNAGLAITMHAPKLQEIPQLAEVMQSQLKEIGMDVTLNVESTDTFYNRWCAVYDSETPPAGCDGGEEFGIVDYGNRGTPDVYLVKAYATGEWNSAHYNSEEFKQAVKDYQAALTLEDRKEPVSRIQQIANADIPYVIPYFYNSLYATSNKVTGIVATGLGHYYCDKASFTA